MCNEVYIAKQKQLSASCSQAYSSSTVSLPPQISPQEKQDLRYRVHELSTAVNVMQSSILDMKDILCESLKEFKGEMSKSSKKCKSKKKKRRVDESPELSSDEDESHDE